MAEKEKLPAVSAQRYRKVTGAQAGLPAGKAELALIQAQGLIVAGAGGVDPFSGEPSQGSKPIIKALRKATEDKDVKAIVLRVDSPGGAGLGCDLVRREVERAAKQKPVVVSMGDMAASGGYWISMAATAITAEPSTYTGSIGIWAVIPSLKGTFEKLGLNPEVFVRGAHADAFDGSRPLSAAEAELFDHALKESYDRFVQLAAAGRHKAVPDMEAVAQGRTWLGKDALEKGLVDKLGGLREAVALAKEKAGLKPDEPAKLLSFDEERSIFDQLLHDDDDDEAEADVAVNTALAAASRKLGLAGWMPKGVVPIAREMLERRETEFPVAEYAIDIR